MKKRLISIMLALCMVLCLMPTAVLAADEVSAKVNGIAVPAAGGASRVRAFLAALFLTRPPKR